MMFSKLFSQPSPHTLLAARLYDALSEQARMPIFYTGYKVQDSIDGRFDLIALHLYLVDRALRNLDDGTERAQALFDRFTEDMDDALREIGASDPSMSKKMKTLVSACLGRFAAYRTALDAGDTKELSNRLLSNVYRSDMAHAPQADSLAAYTFGSAKALEGQATALFTEPPEFADPHTFV